MKNDGAFRSPLERKMLKLVFEFCRSRFGGCMNCYCFFPVFLEQNNKRSVVFLKKKGDKLILSSNQPVSFYNQPVCNHQKVRSTTLSRYVIRTSSKGDLDLLTLNHGTKPKSPVIEAEIHAIKPGKGAGIRGKFSTSSLKKM